MVPAADPPVDCFYVYPTISGEQTINADLAIGFRERAIALAQVARFSQVCRVYAPVYRQVTLSALDHPRRITLADALIAYRSIHAAFRTYLDHYNDGRGIVFIGHSQGAFLLIRLLRQEVDGSPLLRRRLVSALLLGGNVTVARGRNAAGDFRHIPACASMRQIGCVVAYSSFAGKPPTNSQFGRTTSAAGVSLLAPHRRSADTRILCVNPASPSGGTGQLVPALPSFVLAFLPSKGIPTVSTAWVAFPGLGGPFDLAYTRCFLMHQRDRVHVLTRIAEGVRPGGWVVAHEPLRSPPPRSCPHLDLLDAYWELMHEVMEWVGVPPRIVEDLPRAARAAGLEIADGHGFFNLREPETGFELHADTLAAMKGRAIESGIATAAEIDRLINALRAAKDGGYEWVTSPFFLDLTLRKPVAIEEADDD